MDNFESAISEKERRVVEECFNKQSRKPTDEDPVNSPSHYQAYSVKHNIECIDAMQAAFPPEEVAAFCKLNAFKYIWRCNSKNGLEDIQKAAWYLNKYKELEQ